MLGGWKESVIRALFFDVGGTLLQPAEPIGATYASLAVAYGWKAGSEAVQRGFRAAWKKRREEGVGSDKTLGKKGWARIVEESLRQAEMPENFPFEVYFEEVFAYFARPEAWRDFSETGEVIEGIVKKGLRVGVLSNWDPRLRCVLAGFAWAKFLDPILLSEECGVEKPAPAIFQKAQEAVGVGAVECALVGDDPISDLGGAVAAGWRCALVERPQRGLGEALGDLGL